MLVKMVTGSIEMFIDSVGESTVVLRRDNSSRYCEDCVLQLNETKIFAWSGSIQVNLAKKQSIY